MLAFDRADIRQKQLNLSQDIEILKQNQRHPVPEVPARDIEILPPVHHPEKQGLSTLEGQARLLHDLASIELQAMELGLRSLAEYPEAPAAFRAELMEITRDESRHLGMCLEGLRELGFYWGRWPVHVLLWSATSATDTLLDRILIVHRYLEGSGLDAGDQFLRRLNGIQSPVLREIIPVITREEIGHVEFGSRWYRKICEDSGLDPLIDFSDRMWRIRQVVPRRIEKIARDLRQKAGFTEFEIQICEDIRRSFL